NDLPVTFTPRTPPPRPASVAAPGWPLAPLIDHMCHHSYCYFVKRAFDVVAVLAVAPFAAAVTAAMALALAIDFGGNPFFVQKRVGLHGRPFQMYKLRTMRHARKGEQKSYGIDDSKTYVFSPPNV